MDVLQSTEEIIAPEYQNKSVEKLNLKVESDKNLKIAKCLFKNDKDFEGSFEETLVFENSNLSYKKPKNDEEDDMEVEENEEIEDENEDAVEGENDLTFEKSKAEQEPEDEHEEGKEELNVEGENEGSEKLDDNCESNKSEKNEGEPDIKIEIIHKEEDMPITKPKKTPLKSKIQNKISSRKKPKKNSVQLKDQGQFMISKNLKE